MSSTILPSGVNHLGTTPEQNEQTILHSATALISNEVLLPEQFYAPLGQRVSSPEQRLMLAVLEDAVYTILKHAGSSSKRGRRLVREVQRWLGASEPSWPFSFENICAVLGLDAVALRQRLRCLQLQGERTGSTGKALLANPHRVVGRQHKVVLAPSVRRRLRAQQARLEKRKARAKTLPTYSDSSA